MFFCFSFSIIIFVYACVGPNRLHSQFFWSHVNKTEINNQMMIEKESVYSLMYSTKLLNT